MNILPSHFPISPLPLADLKGRREERDMERGAGGGGGGEGRRGWRAAELGEKSFSSEVGVGQRD